MNKIYELSFQSNNTSESTMLFSTYEKAKEAADKKGDRFRRNLEYNWRLDENGRSEEDGVSLFDYTRERDRAWKYERRVGIEGYEYNLEWLELDIVEREVL